MGKIIYQYKEPLGPFNTLYLYDVESDIKSKKRKARFICSFCGNEFNAIINNIKKGSQKSCGCLAKKAKSENGKRNMKDLTNQRFGSLIALEPTNQRNRGQVV